VTLRKIYICLGCILCLNLIPYARASVEWEILKTLSLKDPPIDVVTSANGKWIFVLNENDKILIYSNNGDLEDEIHLNGNISRIQAGPREDILLLTSHKKSTLQVLKLEFIQEIDTIGAPFLGNPEAPVIITVFTDYQ